MHATMTQRTFHGGLTNTTGACPGCDQEVQRRKTWSPVEARDTFDCPACGSFTYGTTRRLPLGTVVFETVGELTTPA